MYLDTRMMLAWLPRLCMAASMATLALGWPAASSAEPLRNLPVCSTARLIPGQADRTPFCTPDRAARSISVTLRAQTGANGAARPELVGNYRVATDNFNGDYMAPVVEARPGDRLTFALENRLAPAVASLPMVHYVRPLSGPPGAALSTTLPTTLTNLHTHGLIVSPGNADDLQGHGDNPFRLLDSQPCDPSAHTAHTAHTAHGCPAARGDVVVDLPTSLPAGVYGNADGAGHPSGLFWYHPHVHGSAQHQVNGGMAGLISVGDPRQAISDPAHPGSTALQGKVDVRYLAIKDIQLSASALPEAATATAHPLADWKGDEFDPAYCGDITPTDLSQARIGAGYCRPASDGPGQHKIWLFTVNGQRYPTINVAPNRAHLWRIANLSATVSYQLHLTDAATKNDVAVRVVALDGVISSGRAAAGSGSVQVPADAIETKSIRLMPASRIEIYVPNFRKHAKVRTLVLRSSGVHTGADADMWPPIDLAEVKLAVVTHDAPEAIQLRPVQAAAASAAPSPAPASAGDGPRASSIDPRQMPLCAHSRLAANQRRVITFATDHPKDQSGTEVEVLEIGSAVVQAGSHTPLAMTPVQTMPHDMNFSRDDHACAVLGSQEVWEIVNTTREIHNFHIHQAKFRQATLAEIAASGGGAGPSVRPAASAAESSNAETDPLFGNHADALSTWHDTFPIPAGGPAGPARVFLHIAFVAPEQVGRFVYHCHILEHEDKGMMAPFEVLLP